MDPNSFMNSLQTYLLEVGLKKIGPSVLGAAVAALLALAAAHQGILESWGVTTGTWPLVWPAGSEPSGSVILIELDTLSKTAIVAISGLVAAFIAATKHHVVAAVTGMPQSGAPGGECPIPGRANDPSQYKIDSGARKP